MLEPLTQEEEIIGALLNNDCNRAAMLMRKLNHGNYQLTEALAGMLDGAIDNLGKKKVALKILGRRRGRPRRQNLAGNFETPGDEIISLLSAGRVSEAAGLLRQVDGLDSKTLCALAFMFETHPEDHSVPDYCKSVRLKIVSCASAGRPNRNDTRKVKVKPDRSLKTRPRSKAWQILMCRRVESRITQGLTRNQAIEEARKSPLPGQFKGQKFTPPSYQAVEKAYDSYKGKSFTGRSNKHSTE